MWNGNLDDTEQVVLYINTQLKIGRSQKDVETMDFKVNQGVIKNRLTRRGYKKIDNQWVLQNFYEDSNTKVISNQYKGNESNNTKVIEPKQKGCDNDNTLVITDNKTKNNLINLAKNYNKIMAIVEQYDTKYDTKYDNITIELPVETVKDFRTSIRINNVVWEQFNKFGEDHKEFTKRDLLSMALREFMEKYK